ncbi:DUF1214 domain-containing protein [Shewanella colwelliana]|uniref:DUF1214 domain-containing protein n=1 Tax=Shewanella colwelliana TaxID=23 RepID=UPI00299D1ADD|nr:DUF1214 domain-containing protein [Shewanella colwelliana]MDX1281886.1 DUF1214 domain-containing protein [Shewanella colwelliana]
MTIKNNAIAAVAISASLIMTGCHQSSNSESTLIQSTEVLEITDAALEDIVRHSYQYVAMYNVNNKFALAQGGWNTVHADTQLKDHTLTDIARPNNDTLYVFSLLDLRDDAVIIDVPAFDSSYASLMVTGYDHYVTVPISVTKNDFQVPEKVLFYTERTSGYSGEPVEGIDRSIKVDGDFVSAAFRVMPHANEPEKFTEIAEQMQGIAVVTLNEYQGKPAKPVNRTPLPAVGRTDSDIYANNFLEVMQFVLNHTTFDTNDPLDQAYLTAMKKLGLQPGKAFDQEKSIAVDGERFRAVADKVRMDMFARTQDPVFTAKHGLDLFKTKGEIDLHLLVLQSVIGPVGLPASEAVYPPVVSADGEPLNAQHDYVIKMSKDELPPAKAFWSVTLYDSENGFFIPNDHMKYSVGENAGMVLNAEGGIDIHISAEKPADVPAENWLPINRQDERLDIIMRIYDPELEAYKEYSVPNAERVTAS